MKIRIAETTYEVGALTKLSLLDVMKVDSELRPYGKTYAQIEALANLTPKEIEEHPDQLWLTGAIIWASRRLAGEALSFTDAVDVPLEDIEFIVEDGDVPPGAGESAEDVEPDPTAAASAQDAAPAPTAAKTTRQTSKPKSAAGSPS